jgi:alcohol dehydrogenase (cytochrome c)
MKRWTSAGVVKALSAAALIGFASQAVAQNVTWDRLMNADKDVNNWLMYHQSFKGYHYSGLDQINANNVKNLRVAWIHTPPASNRQIQSMPIAVDGVLYYTSSSADVFAVDGASGAVVWHYKATLDMERAEGTFYNPYNRGVAVAYGKVYYGTVDGRMIALDQMTGKPVWDKEIVTTETNRLGFTGAPLVVKDKVIIGTFGGELSGCCGPILAVNAESGDVVWQFDTIGGDQRSRDSWGKDSWKVGGGGGWMTGQYDPKNNTVWWGTANPAPDYDWAGEAWMTEGPRPGLNLYSSSVVVLDADSGELRAYFQEMPHDAWDFDSAPGEFMLFEKGNTRYMLHPNKGGIIFVYNADVNTAGRDPAGVLPGSDVLKVENAYMVGETFNYIKGVDPKTGHLIGRRELPEGMHTNVCPAIDGAISWNSGAYNPGTGLLYKVVQEWCFDIEVVRGDRPADYSGQPYFGASWTVRHPQGREAYGHVTGRDPISGKIRWRVEFKYPPLASIMTTKGNLVFVPGADGMFYALDARNGRTLWTHNNGVGHNGGVISYMAKGKQYVAVVTGFGSHVAGNYAPLYGHPFTAMASDSGNLVGFSL